MAETTTQTRFPSRAVRAMRSATRSSLGTSATELPPYFWTTMSMAVRTLPLRVYLVQPPKSAIGLRDKRHTLFSKPSRARRVAGSQAREEFKHFIHHGDTEGTEMHGDASVKSPCPPCLRGETGRLAAAGSLSESYSPQPTGLVVLYPLISFLLP